MSFADEWPCARHHDAGCGASVSLSAVSGEFVLVVIHTQKISYIFFYNSLQGVCMDTSVCGSKGGAAKASRIGATGCEQEPNEVMCCIIASSVPSVTTSCQIAGNDG